MRFEGFHGESSKMSYGFVAAPCNFSYVSMCGSKKNQRELHVSNSIAAYFHNTQCTRNAGMNQGKNRVCCNAECKYLCVTV